MSELVSVLIPAYKAQAYLEETVRSVLAQTWPRIVIAIVDDGSPDGIYEVARPLESPRLKVVRQEDAGAPAAKLLSQRTVEHYLHRRSRRLVDDRGEIAMEPLGREADTTYGHNQHDR